MIRLQLKKWLSRWLRPRKFIAPEPLPPEVLPLVTEALNDVNPSTGEALDNRKWLGLVEDCAEFLGELEEMTPKLVPAAQPMCGHVKSRLLEILERAGVNRIEGEKSFDIARHQAWPPQCTAQGATVMETVEPGLAVGQKVLKRARVKLSK